MRIDLKLARAIASLRTNPNFVEVVEWLAARGEDNTKRAIYTDGDTAAVARGMARESIEILKGIESAKSIVDEHKHIEE